MSAPISAPTKKRRLLFVYSHEYPELWRDGLREALAILKKNHYLIELMNLHTGDRPLEDDYSAILAWGAFGSPADMFVQTLEDRFDDIPKVLFIAGNATPPQNLETYSLFFCETDWYLRQLEKLTDNPFIFKAFGINTKIFRRDSLIPGPVWDYLSVGSFSYWKRHEKIIQKPGNKFVIGEIQKNNLGESLDIMSNLIVEGVGVSDMVHPKKLATLYNLAENVYIPADINGGGERAVWEARACGCNVEVELDNPKLQELLHAPRVIGHEEYAKLIVNGLNHIQPKWKRG